MTTTTMPRSELVLRGPFTLRDAAGLRDRLLAAIRLNPHLVLDIGDSDDIDLGFVQLLLAAQLSARIAGGALELRHPPGAALARILDDGGFGAVAGPWSQAAPG